jgi:zinc/manganese transport system ATP-binding protein
MNIAVAPPPVAVSFQDLTLGYDRHPAVHHLSGEIRKGELLAVVGPNGAGKSTLLKGIMGELRPLGGHINLNGAKTREIGYLPQQNDVDRSFPISVLDCVAMGLWHDIGIWRSIGAAGTHAVMDTDRLVRCPAGSFSACCSPACCCRTRRLSYLTSRFAPSTARPSTT